MKTEEQERKEGKLTIHSDLFYTTKIMIINSKFSLGHASKENGKAEFK